MATKLERLKEAISNITTVTGMARLTRQEHKQIIDDIDYIQNELLLVKNNEVEGTPTT